LQHGNPDAFDHLEQCDIMAANYICGGERQTSHHILIENLEFEQKRSGHPHVHVFNDFQMLI